MNGYFLLLVLAIFGSALSQMFFKILSDKYAGSLQDILMDKTLYLALAIYFFAFVLWIKSAVAINFSVIVPANALIIIFSGVVGYLYFNEAMTLTKLAAYGLILSGVLLLFSTNA